MAVIRDPTEDVREGILPALETDAFLDLAIADRAAELCSSDEFWPQSFTPFALCHGFASPEHSSKGMTCDPVDEIVRFFTWVVALRIFPRREFVASASHVQKQQFTDECPHAVFYLAVPIDFLIENLEQTIVSFWMRVAAVRTEKKRPVR